MTINYFCVHIQKYCELGNFCYVKFMLEKFSCWKIFVGSASYKIILTWKFYNSVCNSVIDFCAAHAHKERQARAEGKNVRRKKPMEEIFRRNFCIRGYNVYKKKYRGSRWRVVGVRKQPQKRLRSICCGCEKGRNYHRTFASKGIAGMFAVLRQSGTIECSVAGCRKYLADLAQGRHKVYCSLPFKAMLMEPVVSESLLLGLKVDNTEPSTKSQVWASSTSTWNGMHCNLHRIVLIIHCRRNLLSKIFREINFCSLMRLRKVFNNQNFPSYGMFTITGYKVNIYSLIPHKSLIGVEKDYFWVYNLKCVLIPKNATVNSSFNSITWDY